MGRYLPLDQYKYIAIFKTKDKIMRPVIICYSYIHVYIIS